MRNSRGIEVKKGYYVWDVSGLEGTVLKVTPKGFVEIQVNRNGHRYQYGTVIDNIVEVLPPMRVGRGGVIRANPAEIHIDIGSHNTKGRNVRAKNPVTEARELWLYARNLPQFVNAARDAFRNNASAAEWRGIALLAARRYSQEFGNGVSRWRDIFTDDDLSVTASMLRDDMQNEAEDDAQYAGNPTPRLTRYDQPSQRERISERTGRPTKTPSARLKNRRLKTHHFAPEGVWANPLTRVKLKSPAQRSGDDPSPRLLKRRRVTAKAPQGFYANPARIVSRYANVENDSGFTYGMDDRTPVVFVFTERERKGRHWYRSFRLPDELIASEQFQQWIHERHGRVIASLSELKRMLSPFMPVK